MIAVEEREKSRLELLDRLDGSKAQTDRNRLGQFATPPDLASETVAYGVSLLPPGSDIRFLAPGFGTGPFYSALLRQVPESRIDAAAGYEVDRHYAEPAKLLWRGTGLRLHVSDFAGAKPPKTEAARYNLAVCNPPYVRHHHLSQSRKRELQAAVRRHTGLAMNGLSGLYAYFMLLSQAWMRQGGVGAWLVPSEFMDVNYGRKVKEFLTGKVTLRRLHRFDPKEVQFEKALVSSAVVFFENSPPPGDHEVEFTFGGALTSPRIAGSFALPDLRHVQKWTRLPGSVSHCSEAHRATTLSDLFSIKRGLATGCNSFFVLTPEQTTRLHLPREFLVPILPGPRDLDTNEVLADQDGEPRIENRRYLLSCRCPENEVKASCPALWDYLQRGLAEGVPQRYLCRHREPWYSQERRPPSPFLCTYMGRNTVKGRSPFRFILNHSKATAANVYLLLYPKPVVASALGEDLDLRRAVWKALSSITAETLMREGRVYGGGLHKLEPAELANVDAEVVLNALHAGGEFRLPRQLELFGT